MLANSMEFDARPGKASTSGSGSLSSCRSSESSDWQRRASRELCSFVHAYPVDRCCHLHRLAPLCFYHWHPAASLHQILEFPILSLPAAVGCNSGTCTRHFQGALNSISKLTCSRRFTACRDAPHCNTSRRCCTSYALI